MEKCFAVIHSCQHLGQLEVAKNYTALYLARHRPRLEDIILVVRYIAAREVTLELEALTKKAMLV